MTEIPSTKIELLDIMVNSISAEILLVFSFLFLVMIGVMVFYEIVKKEDE